MVKGADQKLNRLLLVMLQSHMSREVQVAQGDGPLWCDGRWEPLKGYASYNVGD